MNGLDKAAVYLGDLSRVLAEAERDLRMARAERDKNAEIAAEERRRADAADKVMIETRDSLGWALDRERRYKILLSAMGVALPDMPRPVYSAAGVKVSQMDGGRMGVQARAMFESETPAASSLERMVTDGQGAEVYNRAARAYNPFTEGLAGVDWSKPGGARMQENYYPPVTQVQAEYSPAQMRAAGVPDVTGPAPTGFNGA